MIIGNLPPQSRREDYIETLELTNQDLNAAGGHDLIDLNVAGLVSAGSAAIRHPSGESDLLSVRWVAGGSPVPGSLTSPSTGILQWWFPTGSLLLLAPGPYRLLVSLTAQGQPIELLDAVLPLT